MKEKSAAFLLSIYKKHVKEGKKNEIGDYLKTNDRYKDKVDEIFKLNHRFVSLERDQIKADDMFEEFLFLNMYAFL